MKFGKPSIAEPWTSILLVKTFCSPPNTPCLTAVDANVCRFDFVSIVMLGDFLLTLNKNIKHYLYKTKVTVK